MPAFDGRQQALYVMLVADHARSGRGDLDAGVLGHGGRDARAALVAREGPRQGLAIDAGGDGHVERVRLVHLQATQQIVLLGREGVRIGDVAQAREHDGQLARGRWQRLAVLVEPGAVLGRYTVFKDRQFHRVGTLDEQAAVVGALGGLGVGFGLRVPGGFALDLGLGATAGRKAQGQQERDQE